MADVAIILLPYLVFGVALSFGAGMGSAMTPALEVIGFFAFC